jgi:serine/threonine protein kinase
LRDYVLKYNETKNINDLFINFDQNQIENLNNYQPFQWPKNEDGHFLTENQAMSNIIDHLSKYINNENYEIKDVRNNYTFSIQTLSSKFQGKPDAVIVPNNCDDLERQTRLCFGFKTPQTLKKASQRKLELIASCIISLHPVMVVQTDLSSFYLLIGQNNKIFDFYSTSATKSIEYIKYWLNNICDFDPLFNMDIPINHKLNSYIQMMIHCKKKQSFYENIINRLEIKFTKRIEFNKKSNEQNITEEDIEKVREIHNAYINDKIEIEISGRSGKVYKIQIDSKQYALKLHEITKTSSLEVLEEMQQEKRVYEFLKNKQGNWPVLYYGGYLFLSSNKYYAICTNYIDGVCYRTSEIEKKKTSELIKLKKLCFESIKSLHETGVYHGDIRAPNLIFKDNIAYVIDFGFSNLTLSKEYYNNDYCQIESNKFKF